MRLTQAQLARLKDLAEPNRNPSNEWFFSPRQARTCDGLVKLGLAWTHPSWSDKWRTGYALTDAGRALVASS